MPTDKWIKKMWYIYTMESYSAIKKNDIMPLAATWMDLQIIILGEGSQKDKYMIPLKHWIWKMTQMNLSMKQKQRTHLQLSGGRGIKEGMEWEFGISRWQPLYIYRMTSLVAQTVKSVCLQCGRPGLDPWVRKIPWRRRWQPTPVLLPGKIPWVEEPGRLQSTGSQRVRHDSDFTSLHT